MRAISVSLPVRFVLAVLPPFPCLECFRLEIYAAAKFLFSNSVLGQVDCDLGGGAKAHVFGQQIWMEHNTNMLSTIYANMRSSCHK